MSNDEPFKDVDSEIANINSRFCDHLLDETDIPDPDTDIYMERVDEILHPAPKDKEIKYEYYDSFNFNKKILSPIPILSPVPILSSVPKLPDLNSYNYFNNKRPILCLSPPLFTDHDETSPDPEASPDSAASPISVASTDSASSPTNGLTSPFKKLLTTDEIYLTSDQIQTIREIAEELFKLKMIRQFFNKFKTLIGDYIPVDLFAQKYITFLFSLEYTVEQNPRAIKVDKLDQEVFYSFSAGLITNVLVLETSEIYQKTAALILILIFDTMSRRQINPVDKPLFHTVAYFVDHVSEEMNLDFDLVFILLDLCKDLDFVYRKKDLAYLSLVQNLLSWEELTQESEKEILEFRRACKFQHLIVLRIFYSCCVQFRDNQKLSFSPHKINTKFKILELLKSPVSYSTLSQCLRI